MLLSLKKKLHQMPNNLLHHSKRVGMLGYILARQIGLTIEESKNIGMGGLLHDIGKCTINPKILYKKGKLTEKEFNEIKLHCIRGVNIIKKNSDLSIIIPSIQYHHERWDGQGYFGLKSPEIPLSPRIISIADAFDAMTSYRPYQASRNYKDALTEIIRGSGTHFDPYLVGEFNKVYLKFSPYLFEYSRFFKLIKI